MSKAGTRVSSAKDERPRPYGDDWRFKPVKDQSFTQKMILFHGMLAKSPRQFKYPLPKGKVPVHSLLASQLQILPYAVVPIFARWAYMKYTGNTVNPLVLLGCATLYNVFFLVSFITRINKYGEKYGYLDGEAGRDTITEAMTGKLFLEMMNAVVVRPLLMISLAYDRNVMPNISPWVLFQVFLFSVVLDFWYYWFHRASHEVESLWQYHRRHHTTKHPSAYLAGFADGVQEVFDAVVAPALAYLTFPVSYDTLYIWSMYLIAVEVGGHSGLRMFYASPSTAIFLRPFNLELVIEDHDLHHRFGWKHSENYGKQTRVWDSWFGTNGERLETSYNQVDWKDVIY
ncbi:hypothetical protein MSPP1_002613 [Malassezia sp. CBS 17886]|nr:hypothetical protein MSPP1_002613 [Malassezia sp. CBS 17886]